MSISTIAARFGEMRKHLRALTAGAVVLTVPIFFVGTLYADSPHFIFATDTIDPKTGDLSVSFKEAGLGSGTTVDYTVSADFSGSCVCVTKSGTCPSAANKFTNQLATTSGTFTSGKSGNIVGALTFEAACPTSKQPTCGGGQTLTLQSVSYSNIVLTDSLIPANTVNPTPTDPSTGNLFTCK